VHNSALSASFELVILLGSRMTSAEQHLPDFLICSANWFFSSICWYDVPSNIHHLDSVDHGENSFTKF
jgi:hypothetical protein